MHGYYYYYNDGDCRYPSAVDDATLPYIREWLSADPAGQGNSLIIETINGPTFVRKFTIFSSITFEFI